MKKFLFVVSLCAALAALWLFATSGGPYPALRTGDLVFQTSTSSQSGAILIATANPYTHMGIVKNDGGKIVVIEAGGTVKETPIGDWINRGILSRVAIYRDPHLTQEQAARIVTGAKTL
jgi:Permuted papain-like amidase enzyme, YaeF/YiiX, C92 family